MLSKQHVFRQFWEYCFILPLGFGHVCVYRPSILHISLLGPLVAVGHSHKMENMTRPKGKKPSIIVRTRCGKGFEFHCPSRRRH
jgi:hypothetical protein